MAIIMAIAAMICMHDRGRRDDRLIVSVSCFGHENVSRISYIPLIRKNNRRVLRDV